MLKRLPLQPDAATPSAIEIGLLARPRGYQTELLNKASNKRGDVRSSPLLYFSNTYFQKHNSPLLRAEILVVSKVVNILEARSSGRQLGGIKEVLVELVVSCWSAIDDGAALEYADGLSRVVEAHQRPFVIGC